MSESEGTASRSNGSGDLDGQVLAAIDMGSNSFHMVVAQLQSGELRLVQKFAEKVRLAAGLDTDNLLTDEAFNRGLDCLRRFAQRAENIEPGWLRCIGTNTLRKARNGARFIEEAEKILNCTVEIVAGREEARLVYLGVSHSLPHIDGKRLVFDIGGGSTEFVIGQGFEPILTESLHMGCVGFSERFFPGGQISEWNFFRAVMATRRELMAIEANFKAMGWQHAVGSSGTVKAARNAIIGCGFGDGTVDKQSLQLLIEKLLTFKNTADIDIPGIKPDRCAVLPSGLAIMTGIIEELKIDTLDYSDGALREGALYDMLGRLSHENVCERTIAALLKRYSVDQNQAERVEHTALLAYDQASHGWQLDNPRWRELLHWAALLHEVGLVIAHSGFHKHGAYILENSDMPGFSQQEKKLLAALVGTHRRKIRHPMFEDLGVADRESALKMTLLLRLSVALHRSRRDHHLTGFLLRADDDSLTLQFPRKWLEEHPLTHEELKQEQEMWDKSGYVLNIE